MIYAAKSFTAALDVTINGLTKEVATNTSQWFVKLKNQFRHMDNAQFNRTLKMLLETAFAGAEVGSHVEQQTLEDILEAIVRLAKDFVDATSTAAYKWTAKRVAKYIKYLWESLDQEAKAIIGFAFFAVNEIIETIVLPNIAQM